MCLEFPGPRCSGHTRTNFRKAKENLVAANEDLKQKQAALETARTAEAQAELHASEKAHAVAVAELNTATAKYDESKAKRAVAMEAYRKAKDEYNASPEGIKKNRQRAVNKNLTEEQREDARKAAIEGNAKRNKQKEDYAFQQELKEHEETLAREAAEKPNVESGFVADSPGDFSHLTSVDKRRLAGSHALSQVDQVALLSESDDVVIVLASRSDLTPDVADKLSEHEYYRVRGLICSTAGMRPETLQKLMNDPEPMVQETATQARKRLDYHETTTDLALKGEGSNDVAHESNKLPTYLLERLADSKQERFTRDIAGNSRTNPKRLNALAKHSDVDVRTAVALNPNTASSTITSRIEAGDVDFCKSVFDNNRHKLTVPQLAKMAELKDAVLTRIVLDHPKATSELKARFKR